MIDKSICLPMFGAGLLAMFVIHPYVGFIIWALALVIAIQEVFLLITLPFLLLYRLVTK